jgi:UDP-N-acetylmuramoyl-L-alanyl-D-glutamate--2,6-diaminopimelate ligase
MNKLWLKLIDRLHILYSLWGILFYKRRYKNIFIIGVTGTDGKSSTVVLTARLLRKSGIKTAHYSSISINDGEDEVMNVYKMTTPGRAGLHKFLAKSAKNNVTHAVVEITSEGIKQWRHLGIKFNTLVYTNITPEHIERHGSFVNYKQTKLSLLKSLKNTSSDFVVWNGLDKELISEFELFNKYKNYKLQTSANSINSENPFIDINYQLAKLVTDKLGVVVNLTEAEKQLPGRFEYYKGSPSVLIDYAHTPNALSICLQSARKLCSGRLIHVFGAAGGGRDTWKRPLLAKISEQYADVHILTEENSFDEPVIKILNDIKAGFSADAEVYMDLLREEAIKRAFKMAKPKDLIVCTAKGSETVIAGPRRSKRLYNEREFIKLCLNQK